MKHSWRGTIENYVIQPGDSVELELVKDAAAWHSQSLFDEMEYLWCGDGRQFVHLVRAFETLEFRDTESRALVQVAMSAMTSTVA